MQLVDKATSAAEKVITHCFGNPEGRLKILANDDHKEWELSDAALTLTKAYQNAADKLGLQSQVHYTSTKKDRDLPSEEDIKFITSGAAEDMYLFLVNIKPGKFAQTRLQQSDAAYLSESQCHYAQHFRLGLLYGKELSQYIDSLDVEFASMQNEANNLEDRLKNASGAVLQTGKDRKLHYNGGFEPPKVFCGDFTGRNGQYGGNLPTGEVFTELQNLEKLEGEFEFFAYPTDSSVIFSQPLILEIEDGHVKNVYGKGKEEFQEELQNIKKKNKGTQFENHYNSVRELGIGLNESTYADLGVKNIGSLEKAKYFRENGAMHKTYHISIGPSHKPHFSDSKLVNEEANNNSVGHNDLISYGCLQLY